jgi:hypothetical protein
MFKNSFSLSIVTLVVLFFISACGPSVYVDIQKKYPTLDYQIEVKVLGLDDPIPGNTIELGKGKIGDSGFSTNCGYDIVIEKAKIEARKSGGNLIKITEHKKPGFVSTCHRIKFVVLRQEAKEEVNPEEVDADFNVNNKIVIVSGQGNSRIYIYRLHGDYNKIEFNLYLEDDLICQVIDDFKTEIYTEKSGHNNFWARLEDIVQTSVFIEPDKDYYLKCEVVYGGYFPKIELKLMNREIGKKEYETIKTD